jgi:hypothetical protein
MTPNGPCIIHTPPTQEPLDAVLHRFVQKPVSKQAKKHLPQAAVRERLRTFVQKATQSSRRQQGVHARLSAQDATQLEDLILRYGSSVVLREMGSICRAHARGQQKAGRAAAAQSWQRTADLVEEVVKTVATEFRSRLAEALRERPRPARSRAFSRSE